ncbi:MAG TPA: hypothetical protein VEF76_01130 [Patescibacteria group bacterium]|nr:hypothetical protein [Patescibacteria group bacterium]
MNYSGKKPDPRETIAALHKLKQKFNDAAAESENAASVIADAVNLSVANDDAQKLQRHFTRTAEDQRDLARAAANLARKLEEEEARKAATEQARFRARTQQVRDHIKSARLKDAKSEFAVFVDRSGSITAKPFSAALDAAAVMDAPVCLFAGKREPEWARGDILDPDTRKALFKSGPSSDFAPAVTEMIKTAAVNKLNGRRSHFVVISDGGFHDYPTAKKEMEKLLGAKLRVTVDFVIAGASGSSMEFLSEQLAKDFPGKVRHHLVNGPAYWQGTEEDLSRAVQEKVAGAVNARLHPARSPRRAPPTPH